MRLLALAAAASSWIGLGACVPLRPARVPMPTATLAAPENDRGPLFLLLPGVRDRPETFRRKGFAGILAEHFPTAEVVAVDAHLQYYRNRTVVERIVADVLEPAASDGREIWVVGISLGGLGAVLTARERPEAIDGLLLIAPYLGDERELRQLDELRSVPASEPPGRNPRLEGLAMAWSWLEEAPTGEAGRPRILLACGDDDRLAPGARRLAGFLPPDDVIGAPGGHDWRTWRALLERALARLDAPPVP